MWWKNVIQIKSGITNVDVSAKIWKNILSVKKIIFVAVVAKMVISKYLASIIDNSVIICDDIIEEIKSQQILVKKSNLWNTKFLYFTCLAFFINYYSIIGSC